MAAMTVSMIVQGTRHAATVESNGHRVEKITDENVEKHIMSQETGGDKNAIALLELGRNWSHSALRERLLLLCSHRHQGYCTPCPLQRPSQRAPVAQREDPEA
jgi:hypothetical protein